MTTAVEEKALTAQNIWSAPFYISPGYWNINISGTWEGTIQVQRSLGVYWNKGTHTGSNNAAVLTDGAATYTADELIGLWVENVTDGSTVKITDNTSTTITGVLAGGTDNDWDTGDRYRIWLPVSSGSFIENVTTIGHERENGVWVRAGFATGDYTSGTAKVRISQ